MEKKTIQLNVEATQATKALEKFGGTLEDVYGEGVQPLNFAIGELEDRLYELAAAGQKGSQEFKDIAAEVGRMKKVIIETDMEVDGLSMTMGQKLGGSIGGLAGGFELVQGAMGAFGVESAKVEEALLKVNSAMAIAQGVQSVKEAIPAFKALNAVIMANPIAAVVTAFIALSTAAMAWASDVSTKVSDGFKKQGEAAESYRKNLAKANEEQNKTTEKVLKSLDQEAARRKALGEDAIKVQREINDAKIKELEIAIEQDRSAIRQLNAQKEKLKLSQDQAKLEIASQIREEARNAANSANEIQRQVYLNRIAKLGDEIKKIDQEGSAQIQAINTQLKERISELEAQRDSVEALRTEQIELNREQGERAAEAIAKANEERAKQREIDDYAKELGDEIVLRTKGIEQVNQLELDGLRDRLVKAGELSDQFRDEREQKEKEAEDRLTAYRAKAEEQRYALASSALTTLSELVDAFAGQDEASQRRAFKIKKAAAIAQTTIETYQAAQSAYASQMAIPTPDAPVRAAVAATIAIASGLAKVKSIASQQFEGGGSASGGGSTPSLPTSTPANFNIVGNSNTNQIVEGLNANPVQAYVVSGEVTSAQSLDRNRVKTATL